MLTGGGGSQKMSFSDSGRLHTMLPVLVFCNLPFKRKQEKTEKDKQVEKPFLGKIPVGFVSCKDQILRFTFLPFQKLES